MKQRASAVIVKEGKLLLIRRVKPDQVYYTLPGGTVEEGEKIEDAMVREIKEELSVDAKLDRLLFESDGPERKDYYFLIKDFSEEVRLGGPELERMTHDNQYILEWKSLADLEKIDNFYISGTKEKLIEVIKTNG